MNDLATDGMTIPWVDVPSHSALGKRADPLKLDTEVLIVGAGMSGLATGIQLRLNGFDDFILLEKSDTLGGTWRDNTYLGCTVDIPTAYYSFSFEPAFDWSTFYAPQPELLAYCNACADKYGVTSRIRCNSLVSGTAYDRDANVWVTTLVDGTRMVSRYLVSATGLFSVPKLPDIDGIDSFTGKVFHSTAWDHGYDFSGKRVAVIGTGATGVQIVPEVARLCGKLDVYQRTPPWVMPKPDKPMSPRMKWALNHIPGFRRVLRLTAIGLVDIPLYGIIIKHKRFRWLSLRLRRLCIENIKKAISDPEMRRKLTPRFDFGCRRPTFSNKYYPAFARPNVELVTNGIARVEGNAIIDRDGTRREVDAIICATGFRVFEKHTNPTIPVYGTDGRDLDDVWREHGRQAFKGVTVNGYPNFFIIYGPYSVVSLSFIRMIEASVHHIVKVLKAARKRDANFIEVKAEAQWRDHELMSSQAGQNIVNQGDCVGAIAAASVGAPRPGLRPVNSITSWWEHRVVRMSNFEFKKRP